MSFSFKFGVAFGLERNWQTLDQQFWIGFFFSLREGGSNMNFLNENPFETRIVSTQLANGMLILAGKCLSIWNRQRSINCCCKCLGHVLKMVKLSTQWRNWNAKENQITDSLCVQCVPEARVGDHFETKIYNSFRVCVCVFFVLSQFIWLVINKNKWLYKL